VPAELSPTEVVERCYEIWNEDDVEAFLAITHPEAEYTPSGVFPGMEHFYEGREGIRQWWQTFHEPWSALRVIPQRIVARGNEVAALVRFEGVGRDGIETTMDFINRLEVRDGYLYRLIGQPADEEAIRELGLD
jgi:ketosteroid isomerase-like protein